MELKITGLNIMGTMKVIEAFGNKIKEIKASRNLKSNRWESTVVLEEAEKFAIMPEKKRIEIFECEGFHEVVLFNFQFENFIIG